MAEHSGSWDGVREDRGAKDGGVQDGGAWGHGAPEPAASGRGGPGSRNWRTAARCRTRDAEGLFVTGARQREARGFCRSCPVRTECLAYALDERIEFGVWGGMTERQRRALLRARPEVTSWTRMLLAARDAHYAAGAADTEARAG